MDQTIYLKRIPSDADTAPRYCARFDPPLPGFGLEDGAVDSVIERDSRMDLIHKAVSLLEVKALSLSHQKSGEGLRVLVASDHDFFADQRRPEGEETDRGYLEMVLAEFGEIYGVSVSHFP